VIRDWLSAAQTALPPLMGRRVRYVQIGKANTSRVQRRRPYDCIEASFTVEVYGEVRSWEIVWGGGDEAGAWVDIAGYGRVRANECETWKGGQWEPVSI
jgi:hypothetical protein